VKIGSSYYDLSKVEKIYIALDTLLLYLRTWAAYEELSSTVASTPEVYSFANLAAFPWTWVANTIYIAIDTNLPYNWTWAAYEALAAPLVVAKNTFHYDNINKQFEEFFWRILITDCTIWNDSN
jgi:hypothetical protein